mmetsp:Transcript_175292/g.562216  ORF Transcript_175292/g.562216 Transcript_175292/m.562216 type:complete len:366 (-) Transcript_175292:3-1100(-)
MNCLAISPGSSFFEASQSFQTLENLWSCPTPSMSSAVTLPLVASLGVELIEGVTASVLESPRSEEDDEAMVSPVTTNRSPRRRRSSASCRSRATLALESSPSSSSSPKANIPLSFCFRALSRSSFLFLASSISFNFFNSSWSLLSSRSRASTIEVELASFASFSRRKASCLSSSVGSRSRTAGGETPSVRGEPASLPADASPSLPSSRRLFRDRLLDRSRRPSFFLPFTSFFGAQAGTFGANFGGSTFDLAFAFGFRRTHSAGTMASRPTFGIMCGPAMWSVMPPFFAPRTMEPSGIVMKAGGAAPLLARCSAKCRASMATKGPQAPHALRTARAQRGALRAAQGARRSQRWLGGSRAAGTPIFA